MIGPLLPIPIRHVAGVLDPAVAALGELVVFLAEAGVVGHLEHLGGHVHHLFEEDLPLGRGCRTPGVAVARI